MSWIFALVYVTLVFGYRPCCSRSACPRPVIRTQLNSKDGPVTTPPLLQSSKVKTHTLRRHLPTHLTTHLTQPVQSSITPLDMVQ